MPKALVYLINPFDSRMKSFDYLFIIRSCNLGALDGGGSHVPCRFQEKPMSHVTKEKPMSL